MGRDVGGHADRDARRAVDQQIGETRRQNHWLALGAVVIVAELDGSLVDILGQCMGDFGPAHFGVTHGGRRIAVYRTEVALPVDKRGAHGKFLRHAHQRVVNRLVAMWVILADDIADHAGGFTIGLVPVIAIFVHRKENAAMHGLQPVARIGQRALDDDAHRIVEIRAFQLVFDGDGGYGIAAFGRQFGVGIVAQNASSGAGSGPA